MMKRPAKKMDVYTMVSASERALSYVNEILNTAKEIDRDEKKDERLAKQECKACFYMQRLGGAAMTSQPCMSCHEDQMYSSTSTDALCKPCAKSAELCKHCGGDINMRTRRKVWPKPSIATDTSTQSTDHQNVSINGGNIDISTQEVG